MEQETRTSTRVGGGNGQTAAQTLIAGVGHRYWGDRSVGLDWVDQLQLLSWPPEIEVEDYGFGALAMAQNLEDRDYHRIVFLTAEERSREPATLHVYRYFAGRESPGRVQAYVTEAGAGVVAIDPLLSIAGHFGVLPEETWVVEVEPKRVGWGEAVSPEVEALRPAALGLVHDLVGGRFPRDVEVRRDA